MPVARSLETPDFAAAPVFDPPITSGDIGVLRQSFSASEPAPTRPQGQARTRATASGVSTTSRMRIRPPHFRQTVTSTANTRARRLA